MVQVEGRMTLCANRFAQESRITHNQAIRLGWLNGWHRQGSISLRFWRCRAAVAAFERCNPPL
jgi:hypothetical protein